VNAFGLLVAVRNSLYDRGILTTNRLSHPVISVGNLTTGGTGKTPLVISLAGALRDAGFRPVVLSRGYRRQTSAMLVVSTGSGPLVPWTESGDEPFLIARRVPGAAVVVGADRYRAGLLAESKDLGNLFILDDGFQHRRLFRNVDLVTLDPQDWQTGERLLPLGHWREPRTALSRASAVLIPRTTDPLRAIPVPTFAIETVTEGIYRNNELVPLNTARGARVTAFAGIAKPDRFFKTLEGLGLDVERTVRFRDHHPYTPDDLAGMGLGVKITTEKDALKLEAFADPNLLHVRISARVPEIERLLALVRAKLQAAGYCGV
jgi:tetraacyldisaccharide 4'-kinase